MVGKECGMKIKRLRLLTVWAIACMAIPFALAGCSSQENSSVSDEPIEEIVTIGTESENAMAMEFENATGKNIVEVHISAITASADNAGAKEADATDKEAAATTGPDKGLLMEDVWADGKVARISYQAEAAAPVQPVGENADAADVVLNDMYNVQLVFSDATEVTLHNVSFKESDRVVVHIDEESGLGYLTFKQDDGEASTLEAEKAMKQAAEEAKAAAEATAQAEAEAKAAAEAEASAAEAANTYSSEEYVYEEPVYDTSSNGDTGSSGSNASQSEDQCVDDLVFN